jgi:hypothetical protein
MSIPTAMLSQKAQAQSQPRKGSFSPLLSPEKKADQTNAQAEERTSQQLSREIKLTFVRIDSTHESFPFLLTVAVPT